jgi:phage host-nuclease inhibitor protein Gam
MAKNKRAKSKGPELIVITDWGHADELVLRTGQFQGDIQQAELVAKTKIDGIKKDLVSRIETAQDGIDICIRSLEAFATNHPDDFGKLRSRKLNFGVLGWRKSSFVITCKETLSRIKELFSPSKIKQVVRVKESIDKEAMAKLTEDELASVSAQREEKDIFFVEPNKVEAADLK